MVITYQGDTVDLSSVVGFYPVWPLMGSQAPPLALPARPCARFTEARGYICSTFSHPLGTALQSLDLLATHGWVWHAHVMLLAVSQSSVRAHWFQGHPRMRQQSKSLPGLACRVCQVRKWCRAMELHRREVLRREAAALRPKQCLMKLVAAAEWMEGAEAWQQGQGAGGPARAPRA